MQRILYLVLIYLLIGVKAKNVRHIQIPQYEGLALKDISTFLNTGHEHVFDYMPDS